MPGALSESLRVTKKGGYLLVTYRMNEAAMSMTAFRNGRLTELMERGIISEDRHCIPEPRDLFQMVRTGEIAAPDAAVPADRIKPVATDGAANYLRALIDIMNEATFGKWPEYHFATCERQDPVGASAHTLDILRKNKSQERSDLT